MSKYEDFYETGRPQKEQLDQLLQLLRITWDGDLISKIERDELVELGFAVRSDGFNIITAQGINYLSKSGYICP